MPFRPVYRAHREPYVLLKVKLELDQLIITSFNDQS